MSHKIASLGFEVLPEVLMLEEESGTSEPEPKVANCHQRGHLAWQRESPWTKIGGGREDDPRVKMVEIVIGACFRCCR